MDHRIMKLEKVEKLKTTIKVLNEHRDKGVSIFEQGAASELIVVFTDELNELEKSQQKIILSRRVE